jgi:hypothetical protein
MKSRIIFSAMLIAFASITMFSCKKDKKDSPKELTPEDAKIELNDASQQFDNQIVEIMQTESVQWQRY